MFDELIDLDAAGRAARLSEVGAIDPALRDAVESMLAADGRTSGTLGAPASPQILPQAMHSIEDSLGLVGRVVSHFRVIEPIGAGGMGVVYRAEDLQLHRPVALKFPLLRHSTDASGRTRFLLEARSAAALDHPNLCSIHEVGETEEGLLFLAMTLYPGDTLRDRLDRHGPLPVGLALDVARQAAEGLAYAHAAGIVHRDLKPGNLMLLPGGGVKILDFGLAKSRDLSLTGSGSRLGTVAYMAPEQIQGGSVDGRTDLWALGVVLYEMLTGKRPFGAVTEAAMVHAIVNDEPAPPSELRGDLPPELDEIILTLLEKNPADRSTDAEEVTEKFIALHRTAEPPVPSRRSFRRRIRRTYRETVSRPVRAALILLALAGTLVFGGIGISRRTDADAPVRSVAVLPFTNLSREEGDEYLVLGLHTEVVTQLARLRDLRVALRTAVLQYAEKGEPYSRIGRDQNVSAIVDGTFQRVGDRVNVSAQLIDVATGEHRWADSFDGDATDLLTMQRAIATALAEALRIELSPGEREQLVRLPTSSREAYDAYLLGRHDYRLLGENDLRRALEFFERAVSLDPDFAEAWAARAEACVMAIAAGVQPSLQACEDAAVRALELDHRLAEAHTALGMVKMLAWDWAGSEAAFVLALELDSLSVPAHQGYMQLLRQTTRRGEALALIRRAESIDPTNLLVKTQVGWVLFDMHRYDEALAQWSAVLAEDPEYWVAAYNQGLVFALRGEGQELRAAADRAASEVGENANHVRMLRANAAAIAGDKAAALRAIRGTEGGTTPFGLLARVHLLLGEEEKSLAWLERGVEQRDMFLPGITSEPWFDELRDHPRFREVRRRMGLEGV